MIINIRVPDEEVKQIGAVLRGYLSCTVAGSCDMCENYIACQILSTVGDALYNGESVADYLCEVRFNEE